ncbi:hypothetical protein AK812_SmicGene44053 [Symbiodinium microadriaticum]|uniref:Calcineurin-like phosphoesterase domain-containing protein n=1 Tax=Symbiodinium microadriaticum TaxID=2951 RepID=A0A1Q9BZG1_SYMMI|nr:hypothetical protein AK812_SmicGene44053 [Symbiodinium microadriaticum]CAE7876282.1 unnamed protein product [Symbiodinium microadriaticum]
MRLLSRLSLVLTGARGVLASCIAGECPDAVRDAKDAEPSLLQLHHQGKSWCTANGQDPWASGQRVDCCAGLDLCFGEHQNGPSYRCESSCGVGSTPCTPKGQDPFQTSSLVECCSGLEMCMGQYGSSEAFSYRCFEQCPASCTQKGDNVYQTGRHVPCCGGLEECSGDWNMDGQWSHRCFNKCWMGEYHPHFDTTPDYLDIAASARGVRGNDGELSDNYYLVIGDNGGSAGGCDGCCGWQWQVANKMKEYVRNRKAANPRSTLLFILLVGDNFYWTGASPGRFDATWKSVYQELADYPWFVILGNHDFGNDDPDCLCPFFHERARCTAADATAAGCGGAKPYSIANQSYACNQLNADKGGVDGDLRRNFHIPDFTFFYTIPELDFELIGLDYNWYDRHGIGGNGYGPSGGGRGVAKSCGGVERVEDSLARLRDASNKILDERAKAAAWTNYALISHYPDWAQEGINLRHKFLQGMHQEQAAQKRVLNFYGHTHIQQCDRHADEEDPNLCTDILTGGAGGCCGDKPAGFVAVTWNKDGKMTNECFLEKDCTIWEWSLLQDNATRSAAKPTNVRAEGKQEVCHNTVDDPRCPGYAGPLKL